MSPRHLPVPVRTFVDLDDPASDPFFPKAAEAISIRVTKGSLTLLDRKLWNHLISNAFYTSMANAEEHRIRLQQLRGSHESNDRIKESLRRLQTTLVEYDYLRRGKKHWVSAQLVGSAHINETDGVLTYSFPKAVRPFLASPAVYARIGLRVLERVRSKYALVLYEHASLWVKQAPVLRITVEKLMAVMDVDGSLRRFSNFAQKALVPAIEEINQSTDLTIEARYLREGRRVQAIEFTMRRKSAEESAAVDRLFELARGDVIELAATEQAA